MSDLVLGIIIGTGIGFFLGIILICIVSINRERDKEENKIYGEINIKNNK
ncbi:hypothetical protein [uncultured Fusobacterium sp.]|nr:hypothetical protein [uncultured Fusobacterium sp.]